MGKSIKLMDILNEGLSEILALEFVSNEVKSSPWSGKVYLAGGAVRDEMLGIDSKDIDLVVALPNGGIAFANWLTRKLGIHSDTNPVVFERFGTAKFNLRGIKYKGVDLSGIDIECVMTRSEKYDGATRKPDVAYGDLAADVERRDFTVNSLLKDLTTGEILDLTGKGKADIQKGVVRSAIDPNIIFREDPLRMLRAIRFTVKYNWSLPLFMIKALKANAHMLKNISMERIQDELNKMIMTGSPDKAIRLLQMTGLSQGIMPELDLLIGLSQNRYHKWDTNKHTLQVLKNVPADLKTRLAALFHDIGKATTRTVIDNEVHFYSHEDVGADVARDIMKRLKYPNDIIDGVCAIVKNHMRLKQAGFEGEIVSDKSLRQIQVELGDHLQNTLDVMHADNIAHADIHNMPNQIPGVRARMLNLKTPTKITLPIDGFDIMKDLNIKPGPMIKILLSAITDAYYSNPHMTPREALQIARDTYRDLK
jgi:poly(A) polymerase